MKLIPLTLYCHGSAIDVVATVHINPEYIVGIEAEYDSYGEYISTRITFVGGGYYTVTETPREIIAMMTEKETNCRGCRKCCEAEIEDEGW